jgi:hypothetical protein
MFGILRDFIWYRALRSKTAMIWIIFSTAFVISFPTLASAMTGYAGNSKAYVQDADGNLIPWNFVPAVDFIINDGWRINLTGNYPILSAGLVSGQYFSFSENHQYIYSL